jgi:hypothetical protein
MCKHESTILLIQKTVQKDCTHISEQIMHNESGETSGLSEIIQLADIQDFALTSTIYIHLYDQIACRDVCIGGEVEEKRVCYKLYLTFQYTELFYKSIWVIYFEPSCSSLPSP